MKLKPQKNVKWVSPQSNKKVQFNVNDLSVKSINDAEENFQL